MTKEQLTVRITEKENERSQIIKADQEQGQARQKQFEDNVKRVNQLDGAIGELKALRDLASE